MELMWSRQHTLQLSLGLACRTYQDGGNRNGVPSLAVDPSALQQAQVTEWSLNAGNDKSGNPDLSHF